MGYKLEGGPRHGEYADEVPEGYIDLGIHAGVVSREGESPVPRAVWKADREKAEEIIKEQGYRPGGDL
ncbi:hypothetical protein [Microbacterium sp. BF1]|uniref:hypothetical protein n=1 Tax=Microbacterium sp. BF1 TaxID=2821146 RepID=UPI000D9A06B0|nr:hypothetical protein [Microbacterium sp. BF1]